MSYRRIGKKGNRRAERGSILATSALGMLSLLLAVGLGVDISHLYLAKNELKNAEDAEAISVRLQSTQAGWRSVQLSPPAWKAGVAGDIGLPIASSSV